MDISTVESLIRPGCRADLPAWRPDDCLLAGGTDVLSGSHPGITRLIDLQALQWLASMQCAPHQPLVA